MSESLKEGRSEELPVSVSEFVATRREQALSQVYSNVEKMVNPAMYLTLGPGPRGSRSSHYVEYSAAAKAELGMWQPASELRGAGGYGGWVGQRDDTEPSA